MTSAEQCVANIGTEGRRKRMVFGVVTLVVAVGLWAGLVHFDADRWWRLAVFLPLLLAGIGIFQARART
jgi:hypothetical protein